MTEYGSGPTLDEDFDFTVDETGDIQCTNQVGFETAELEKDLAFTIARRIDLEVGSRTTPAQQASIKSLVRNIILRDSRIARILDVNIEQLEKLEDGSTFIDGYEISARVVGTDDDVQQELIIEV